MSGTKRTGVTLQTLDEKSFDSGVILAQTPEPFLAVPQEEHCTYAELLRFISPKAASMLVQGLQNGLFIPPLVDVGNSPDHIARSQGYEIAAAPKITPDDKRIFSGKGLDGIKTYRQYCAVGRLWCNICIDTVVTKRLILEDITLVKKSESIADYLDNWEFQDASIDGEQEEETTSSHAIRFIVSLDGHKTRQPRLYIEDGDTVVFYTVNSAIRVGTITIDGQSRKPAAHALRSIQRKGVWQLMSDPVNPKLPWMKRVFVEPV